MKIITKHRDYYDGMVSVYGRDEKIVCDRRATELIPVYHRPSYFKDLCNLSDSWETWVFSICGEFFPVSIKNHNDEIRWLPEHWPKSFRVSGSNASEWRAYSRWTKYYGKTTYQNTRLQQPVLFNNGYGSDYIPVLAEFGFPKIISANDMYHKIYTWLCWSIDNPPVPNNQTDKEKVVSHGFDAKTSFRKEKA